jgi:hypothetical protein
LVWFCIPPLLRAAANAPPSMFQMYTSGSERMSKKSSSIDQTTWRKFWRHS